MPVVQPADIWRETGRYDAIGPEMARFKDRAGRDMVLAMTHEEVVADLLRDVVRSYRQLPVQLYHFQTKFRDEPRSRGGLIRVREFTMKDAYSCDLDEAGLDVSYQAQYGAYSRIFERLGLDTIVVGADVGMMGGTEAHEFMLLTPVGEDTLVLCDACGYAANRQIANVAEARAGRLRQRSRRRRSRRPAPRRSPISPRSSASPPAQTAKAIFFVADDGRARHRHRPRRRRGQRDQARQRRRRAATCGRRARRRSAPPGMEPGYASPIGAHDTFVVVDDLAAALAQPRRRREPGRLPPAQRQRRPRLHAGPRHRHRERPRRRSLPALRLAA